MASTRPAIIRSVRLTPRAEERIAAEFDAPPAPEHPLNTDEVFRLAEERQACALLVTHTAAIRGDDVARIPECVKLVATVSVGLDHLDVPAIRARGIQVSNTPDVLTDCNADLAMMLIIAASRRVKALTGLMEKGWGRQLGFDEMLGRRVSGKTLGIIGMGRIGQAVAKRAAGFDMKVLYHNRRRLDPKDEHGAIWCGTLEEMLPHCQILSLHLPGNPESDSLINAKTLSLLPRGAVFVNAARGILVDEDALLDALKSGQLFGAGLDVCRNEPNPDPRLLASPDIFMTPHAGSATLETRTAMGMLALDNAACVAQGRPLITPVT